MDWREAKKRLLQDKGRREAYEKVDLEYEIGKMITDARILTRMTQQKLAKLAGTKQPSIARLERGDTLPSLSFLRKIAEALGTQLLPPRFEMLERRDRRETESLAVFVHFVPLMSETPWSLSPHTLGLISDNASVLSKNKEVQYAHN